MSILGYDLANAIQSDYLAHAARERLVRAVCIQPKTSTNHTPRSIAQRLQLQLGPVEKQQTQEIRRHTVL